MNLSVEWPLVRASVRAPVLGDEVVSNPSMVARELEELKQRVPSMRDRVGRKAWERAVTPRLPFGAKADVASRAYHKMREMQQTCGLARASGLTVHLCEAPGGFVQAVGDDEPAPDWTWIAVSLGEGPSPALDKVPTDRGHFVEGDVFDHDWCATVLPTHTACLVTADGAWDLEHDRLEAAHLPLLHAETFAALRCLRENGDFVTKFFEGLKHGTQNWIAYMTTRFRSVGIVKPLTSRPTNSERYLVCRGFCADLPPDLHPDRMTVAAAWRADLVRIVDRMATDQITELRRVFAILDQTLRRVPPPVQVP